VSELGDTGIVNFQLSSWNSKERARLYTNLAVVPSPWWDWARFEVGIPPERRPTEQYGLFRQRLEPLETERARPDSWDCWDTSSARSAVEDLRDQLLARALPRIAELSDRGGMIAAVRQGDVGDFSSFPFLRAVGLVVLLSDVGGPEFERACDDLRGISDASTIAGTRARADQVIEWSRQRASI
jgi:hypothetical protein